MPYFLIDCSENIITMKTPAEIMQAVYDAAEATGLFMPGDTKVRLNTFKYFKLGEGENDFIHVFGNIMEGRSAEQKSNLSRKIVSKLNTIFPDVPSISIIIKDSEKASYCNKSMVLQTI